MSFVSYCPLAWHFCSVPSTNKLEQIQERALRFINNDHEATLSTLPKSRNTQPLHVRRLEQMACKGFFGNVTKLHILAQIKSSTYDFRKEKNAAVSRVNSKRYGMSISYLRQLGYESDK